MIAAAGQALEADPAFRPDLAIIGTTSGGMSFGENYYRALHGQKSLRPRRRGSPITLRKSR